MGPETMKKSLILAAVLAAAGAFQVAQAAPAEHPIYVGAGIGYSHIGLDATPGADVSSNGTGFNFYTGYKFNETFAAELGYAQLGDIKVQTAAGEVASRNTLWSVSGLAYAPVAKDLNVFGRVGLGESRVKLLSEDVHKTSLVLGVGGEYKLSPNYALRAEVQYVPGYADSHTKLYNVTAGLKASF